MLLDTVLFNSLAALVLLVIALIGAPLPPRGVTQQAICRRRAGVVPVASRVAGPACLVTSRVAPAWPALPERPAARAGQRCRGAWAELAGDPVCVQSPHLPGPRAGAYLPVVLAHWGKLSGAPGGRSLAFVLGNMLSAGGDRPQLPAPGSLACRRGRSPCASYVQPQGAPAELGRVAARARHGPGCLECARVVRRATPVPKWPLGCKVLYVQRGRWCHQVTAATEVC